ncbi:MAG: HAD family hydrolase [Cytophagales bacterium]|nr:MAG: HAD family hydrolase [Cytophagales bacterium]
MLKLIKNPKAKALIFDLDGTLADTMPNHYKAWSEVANFNGFHFPEDLFYKLAGIPTFKIVDMLNEMFDKKMDPEETHEQKENAFLKLIHTIQPIQPVLNLAINYFGKIPMSVGTGGVPDVAALTLQAINAESYFDIIVTARDVKNFKPAPDTFLRCAELMNVNPEECEVFEDSPLGLEAAIKAGMIATDIRPYYLNSY